MNSNFDRIDMNIPFNKPYITGKEVHYIYDAAATSKISGNGKYAQMCQKYFEERWGFKKTNPEFTICKSPFSKGVLRTTEHQIERPPK